MRALVTGLNGQDGSFLAELLLERGYEVSGLVRGTTLDSLGSAEHVRDRVELVHGDLLERGSLTNCVRATRPDELYHLAAPSAVPEAWQQPARALAAIAGGTASLLEAVREHSPRTRMFVAVSGQIFGDAAESPQNEHTLCRPRNVYAVAKLAAHHLVGALRAHDGLYVCSGILYNHESERRPEHFVSRKVTRAAAAIKLGLEREIVLGDLDTIRDWSFAGDIMHGAWLMLQQDEPQDLILASGIGHTVGDLVRAAFEHVGLDTQDHIRVDESLVRPPESTPLVGDASRARKQLGWTPAVGFEALIARMVDADLAALEQAAA